LLSNSLVCCRCGVLMGNGIGFKRRRDPSFRQETTCVSHGSREPIDLNILSCYLPSILSLFLF
jgi:hypothetical protein